MRFTPSPLPLSQTARERGRAHKHAHRSNIGLLIIKCLQLIGAGKDTLCLRYSQESPVSAALLIDGRYTFIYNELYFPI